VLRAYIGVLNEGRKYGHRPERPVVVELSTSVRFRVTLKKIIGQLEIAPIFGLFVPAFAGFLYPATGGCDGADFGNVTSELLRIEVYINKFDI
jgi:hypothetical protein